MAATQEKSLSQFPTATQILLTTLLFGSVVDATSTSGYDSVKILVSDLAEAILGDFAYTQDLATDAKTIFGAINSIRVLSGTATPNNAEGANGQIYVKYASADYSVVALYVKLNNAWREISTGGGGGGASVSMGTTEPTAASGSDGDLYVQYDGTTYEVVAMFVKINGAWRTIATGEVIYSDFITSLSAGSTSVTISDSLITTASTIDVYTDTFGVNPTDVAISTGSVTLTFNAQSDAVSIKVRVWRGVKGTIDAEVINDTTTSEYTTWSSEKIAEELGAKSDGDAIADEYDSTQTYTAGDYVMYGGKLYRCNHIGATGTWEPTWWDETSATDYTKSVNTALTTQINNIHDDTADAYSASSTYAVGDLCIAFGRLYRCTTAIATPEAWNASHWAATTIADEIAAKQNTTDNSLNTTNKQIVPAINEVVSGKANKAVVVSGITKNSNIIGDAEITVLRIDKVVFVKAHLKAKAQITTSDQILLSGLPERSGYRNANTFPCIIIGNEYFNTDSEVKGVWIDGSGNLNLSSTTTINADRAIVIDFWYYSA